MNGLPPCPLIASLNPPASLTVGTPGSLILNIANPANSPSAVVISGTRKLPPFNTVLSRSALEIGTLSNYIAVYGTWGTGAGNLCSATAAKGIAVNPTVGNWTSGPETDPTSGPWWALFPPANTTTLDPGDSLQFTLAGIKVDAAAGMCLLYVDIHLDGYATANLNCPVYKVATT